MQGASVVRYLERSMAGGAVVLVDLVKRFADVTAVAGINLDMPPGEFFSLLGPSGCGKTTTLRLIAGFERPDEGRILLDGIDMAQTPPHKRNVNTVFQNYALFPHLTVADNVGFGLRYKDVSKQEGRKRISDALALVRLEGLDRRRPSQLSGGQQQRVALARALILGPKDKMIVETEMCGGHRSPPSPTPRPGRVSFGASCSGGVTPG